MKKTLSRAFSSFLAPFETVAHYNGSTFDIPYLEKNIFSTLLREIELKELLDTGKSFTYEEAVQKLGGVEGVLDSKTSTSDGYMWVDKHGRTFRATFSTTINNKCSIMTLR